MADKEYDNTNRGALFNNDRKEKETHPDFTGSINVDGKEFWIKGWKKTSKAGNRFLSLSVDPKEDQPKKAQSDEEAPF